MKLPWYETPLGRTAYSGGPARPRRRNVIAAGAFSNLTNGFSTSGGSVDRDVYGSLRVVRQRARWLAYNNDYVRRWLAMCETHIVGPNGFSLQVRALFPDGVLDEVGNSAVETAFWKWARRGSCEVTGRMAFRDVLRTAIRSVARDGECLIRKVDGTVAGNPELFALQVVDIDRLDIEKSVELRTGNIVKMGVEINTLGRPVAYHLRRKHPGDDVTMTMGDDAFERVPASSIYYLGVAAEDRPNRPGACRGWSRHCCA